MRSWSASMPSMLHLSHDSHAASSGSSCAAYSFSMSRSASFSTFQVVDTCGMKRRLNRTSLQIGNKSTILFDLGINRCRGLTNGSYLTLECSKRLFGVTPLLLLLFQHYDALSGFIRKTIRDIPASRSISFSLHWLISASTACVLSASFLLSASWAFLCFVISAMARLV